MADWNPQANDIFLKALDIRSPEERLAFLDSACTGNAGLRAQIESLLAASDQVGSFLESPAPALHATTNQPNSEQPGTIIGPYKLLQQIGEGGMGVVYMAQQTEPVERRVALKIIKPGMDSRKIIARFEAERQALALMDHPNIAKVLDAGTTGPASGYPGRPYFVMELVKGVPITEYCDEKHLTIRQRLELLLPVCQAVQHAHQKGIIHRDIKPSNVMVALYDGRPVPKVIDFGVAKATGSRLTDKTVFTEFGQVVGTLEYMSPEQAELNQLDVDTRSDIYSLGVLLYELLTGTTPLERKRLCAAAFDEMLRMIREEDPPKPSTRLSTTNEGASIAANRGLEPKKLSGLVRGELDWIVMKALEKDRSRRYETANGLAMDISRYLADEAVQACPPSATYRFRKFARRNRVALVTVLLVSSALVLGTVVSTWQALRAEAARAAEADQRKVAESARMAEADQRKIAEQERAAAESQRLAAEENFQKARKAVDEYFTIVSESTLLDVPGLQPLRKKLLESALRFYDEFAQQRNADPAVLADLAVTYMRLAEISHTVDKNDEAFAALDKALDVIDRLRREFPTDRQHHRKLAGYWKGNREMQVVSEMPKDPQAAFQSINRLVGIWQALAEENPDELGFRSDLAALYFRSGELLVSGRHAEGLAYIVKAKMVLEELAREQPKTPAYRADLAACYEYLARIGRELGRKEEAESNFSKALAIRERLVAESPDVPQYQIELAFSLTKMAEQASKSDPAEAEKLYRRVIIITAELVTASPSVPVHFKRWLDAQNGLVDLLVKMGRETQANEQRLYGAQFVRQLERNNHGEELERVIAVSYGDRGDALARSGRREEGLAMFREAIPRYEKLAANPDCAARVRSNLGHCYRWIGGLENDRKAAAIFARLMAEVPSYKAYQEHLASTLLSIGENLARERDFTAAETSLQRAIELDGRLAADAPENFGYRGNLARDLRSYGDMLFQAGRADEAEKAHRRALDVFEKLAAEFPADLSYQDQQAHSHREWADLQSRSGRHVEAAHAYAETVAVIERMIATDPSRLGLQDWRNNSLFYLANELRAQGRLTESEATFRRLIDLESRLADEHPQDSQSRRQGIAGNSLQLARLLAASGRNGDAEAAGRKALELREKLVADFPNVADYQSDLARSLDDFGVFVTKDSAVAEKAFHRAIEINEKLAADHPNEPKYRVEIGHSLWQLANLSSTLGQHDEAEKTHRRASDVFEKLAADVPTVAFYRQEQGFSYWHLGWLMKNTGRPHDAEEPMRQALAIHAKLTADFPNEHEYRARLARSYTNVIEVLLAQDKQAEAEKTIREAVEKFGELAAAHPAMPDYWRSRAAFQRQLAQLQASGKRALEAEKSLFEAINSYEKIIAEFPQYEDLWQVYSDLAHALAASNRPREADEAYRKVGKLAPNNAETLNNLAWGLATSADSNARNASLAVELAKKAIELDPTSIFLPNTLGVAHYRAGNWQDAIEWLKKSMELRKGGDSLDWFFLAMAHEQLGHKGEAREWFDQAVEWMEKHAPQNEELLRFRHEAEDLIVGKPAVDANSKTRE